MKFSSLLILLLLLLNACSTPIPHAVKVDNTDKIISYLHDVKPILDKRCVTCHSCYNSPCQAKMSSFEGIDRGASKELVYDALRLKAAPPTRLFIDANSTDGWRKKGFYTLTQSADSNATYNDSIMMHLLYDKKMHPELVGEYAPQKDKLICPRDKKELADYLDEKPNHGMPYGFPALKESEYKTLASWLVQGAHGPTDKEQKKLITPSKNAQKEIDKWEDFFNRDSAKQRLTSRYLYEHLYLAHIYFPTASGEFYQLIRSYTPSGVPAQIIPTLRPFDSPKVDIFYYRLVKIHTTIVHKTHMVLKFDDTFLARLHKLFIEPSWSQTPVQEVSYKQEIGANPFVAFEQIPIRSRYQFLLDNSHFIMMNFIRGPVCRGQMALNVINDHFWIMFRDPEYDMAVRHPEFIKSQVKNLQLPIESVNESIFKIFSDAYIEHFKEYYKAKTDLALKEFPNGMPIESIWKGERSSDAPFLTIYRHFDSASIHKGPIGEEPKTVWVVDYSQLERIYYNLVAGYDVFGNVSHQTNVRRYTDFLRSEGELNFLEYMPKDKRLSLYKSWYIGDDKVQEKSSLEIDGFANSIRYKTKYPKSELVRDVVNHHLLKSIGYKFDDLNYVSAGQSKPTMPKVLQGRDNLLQAARSLTAAGSGFITYMTDSGANNLFLRIDLNDGTYIVKNLVINRWHDNVNSLFAGSSFLDASKDTMDILEFSVGSYPNAFIVVQENDLADFLELMKTMSGKDAEIKKLKRYFLSRSDKEFWKIFDWFNARYKKEFPIESGLYDLNRYARTHWEKK